MIAKKNALLVKTIILSVMVLLFCGCNEKREVTPPSDIFPVSGKVLATSGQIPVGYTIMLTPNDMDMEKAATGIVSEDGSFSLQTRYMGERFDGVIQGTYRVALGVPYEQGGQVINLPQVVEISGETTDLTIQFPSGRE